MRRTIEYHTTAFLLGFGVYKLAELCDAYIGRWTWLALVPLLIVIYSKISRETDPVTGLESLTWKINVLGDK